MREIDELLQRRPGLGTLAGRGRGRCAPGCREERGPVAPDASALTAAELAPAAVADHPPAVPRDRRRDVPFAAHHQDAGEVDLPELGADNRSQAVTRGPRARAPGGLTTRSFRLIRAMDAGPGPGAMVSGRRAETGGDDLGQTVRFQEILRRLAIIDEGFVEDQAGLGLGLPGPGPGSQDRGAAAGGGVVASGRRGSAWNGAPGGRWRRARGRGRDRRRAAGDRPGRRARPGRLRRSRCGDRARV